MNKEYDKYVSDLMYLVSTKDDFSQLLFDADNFGDQIGFKSLVASADDADRPRLIRKELDRVSSEILREYFTILLDENDLWLFDPTRYKGFAEELNKQADSVVYMNLTTAVPLNPEDIKELCDRAGERFGRKVVMDVSVDESVLGGAVIKKDNYILDFSLKTKLAKLTAEWKKSVQNAEGDNG